MKRRITLLLAGLLVLVIGYGASDYVYQNYIKNPNDYVNESIAEWGNHLAGCSATLSSLAGSTYTAKQVVINASADCASAWATLGLAGTMLSWGSDSRLAPETAACARKILAEGPTAVIDYVSASVAEDSMAINAASDRLLLMVSCSR
jgi:hypothetical protein